MGFDQTAALAYGGDRLGRRPLEPWFLPARVKNVDQSGAGHRY
ncbi:hypothetical protein YT1_0163 [Rhodococcus ruber]|nr:hypothetical protein YT1_0163 [Rhodococcus ruber]